MQPNRIKALWAEGKPVLNGWLGIPSPYAAEIMAEQGYDAMCVDLQHGAIDDQACLTLFQALRTRFPTPLARVPWLDPGAVMRALDAGAYGVICPMINSGEEAARLVSYVRYPPLGVRSYGPFRAALSGGSNYGAEANRQLLCLAMIETAQAVRNLEEIVATPGLDGIYIGPSDLTLSTTGTKYLVGFDRREPEMLEMIQRILATAHAAGIKAGLHCVDPAYAAEAIGWGFDLVTLSGDARCLAEGAAASIRSFRQALRA